METADQNKARALIDQINRELARRHGDITEQQLKELYKRRFRDEIGQVVDNLNMDPGHLETWGWLFGFRGNRSAYVGSSARLRMTSEIIDNIRFAMIHLDFWTESSENPIGDLEFLERTLARLKSRTFGSQVNFSGRPSEDLRYLGGNRRGIEWFLNHCDGAKYVFNTVFARSQPNEFIDTEIGDFQKAQVRLIELGCIWKEIVLERESDSDREWSKIVRFQQDMRDDLKARYVARKIITRLPMLQCLTIQYQAEEQWAVLAGWSFPGSHGSIVFQSSHPETGKYFARYCGMIFEQCSEEIGPEGHRFLDGQRSAKAGETVGRS